MVGLRRQKRSKDPGLRSVLGPKWSAKYRTDTLSSRSVMPRASIAPRIRLAASGSERFPARSSLTTRSAPG
jgi:hypothetical protein